MVILLRAKKGKAFSKHTPELLDWMLAIDYDVSKLPKSLGSLFTGI
jgi:hypothetical protein